MLPERLDIKRTQVRSDVIWKQIRKKISHLEDKSEKDFNKIDDYLSYLKTLLYSDPSFSKTINFPSAFQNDLVILKSCIEIAMKRFPITPGKIPEEKYKFSPIRETKKAISNLGYVMVLYHVENNEFDQLSIELRERLDNWQKLDMQKRSKYFVPNFLDYEYGYDYDDDRAYNDSDEDRLLENEYDEDSIEFFTIDFDELIEDI